MISKPATTEVKIDDILQNRWSPRAFDANKPVTGELLAACTLLQVEMSKVRMSWIKLDLARCPSPPE